MDFNSTKFVIFNVYLPYQCNDNEEDYITCLSGLKEFIEGLDITNFLIIGDWNANLSNYGTTLFQPLMLDFCNENQLTISSKWFLPESTYTHVHTREDNCYYSWLYHVVSSSDCHKAIRNMTVHYDMSDDDHIPISFSLQVESLPQLTSFKNDINGKIKWDCVLDKNIKHYYERTAQALGEIEIPVNSVLCTKCDCSDTKHTDDIEKLFNAIKSALYNASDHIMPGNSKYSPRPGWNEYVSDLYDFSRETRRMWLDHGKPRQGLVHNMFVKSKLRFKLALRYITKNEDALRRESLAKKLSQLSSNDFWKEISSINNSRAMLPTSIEDASGADEICKLWKNHFESIFNCLKNVSKSPMNYVMNCTFNEIKVSINEVKDAIQNLVLNKSCGSDNIYAEHIKYASEKLIPLISICFTSCFVHGFLPTSLLTVVLVPIIKNKAGNVNAIDNYRPVALSNIFCKVLEIVILGRIKNYLSTSSNQFGFKKKHGTDLCIYTLKEIVSLYTRSKGCVFAGFLDASKAFDRVNHSLLFEKLAK